MTDEQLDQKASEFAKARTEAYVKLHPRPYEYPVESFERLMKIFYEQVKSDFIEGAKCIKNLIGDKEFQGLLFHEHAERMFPFEEEKPKEIGDHFYNLIQDVVHKTNLE